MKLTKKILVAVLSLGLLLTSITLIEVKEVSANTVYEKLEIEDMQLNKARIKTGDSDSNGKHVETYWQQEPLDTFDKLTDITFARTVLDAPTAGEYTFQIHCKNETGGGSITLMLYVNGTGYEVTVSGTSYQTVDKTVTLEKGSNSIVLAWVNWGYFDYINYSNELKVVKQSAGNKYYAFESALNEVQLSPTTAFHAPKASLYTAPIVYDSGDEEWQGSATFTVDAASTIKSINLHYYAMEYNNGKAMLGMSINGGKEVEIDLSGSKTAEELVKSISEKALTEAGFKAGQKNVIKFRQPSATGGKIGLYSIELKEEAVVETTTAPTKATRYETEGALIISGGKIKVAEGDNESWSGGEYVGEFAPANITKPSQIDEYCSNIGYVQYEVKADKAGYYQVTLGYATEVDMPVYVTSGYEWSKIDLTSTGSWNAVGEKQGYVYLKKGTNNIWVTGPASEDVWVNYDYIDVEYAEAGTLDTSKTVLFMDKKVNKINSKEVETTVGEEDTTASEEPAESLTSPQTGKGYIVVFLLIAAVAGVGLVITRKTKRA